MIVFYLFYNCTTTSEIYTLSLHDALPISTMPVVPLPMKGSKTIPRPLPSLFSQWQVGFQDRKSTRLNSSHVKISYAVFCLKKKKKEFLKSIAMIALSLVYLRLSYYVSIPT